ncbi:Heat shock cognate protein [Echinococcus granulosus]|uniref:Heat shock cognate protein n=1 Tax=Echinococcus granulosus TaxID=6210 RepID=W6UFB9_ECHGR|nr:Heat shock cognate protein [Echinococcus granulosus]EUB56847.1 Heat shock cognate protein [Echinococcus granulosus]
MQEPRATAALFDSSVGRFNYVLVQSDTKHRRLMSIHSKDKAKFGIEYIVKIKGFVSSILLPKVKNVAEAFMGAKLADAMTTVSAQRQKPMNASKLSSLNVLHIINEPTAATTVCDLDKRVDEESNVPIFHLDVITSLIFFPD